MPTTKPYAGYVRVSDTEGRTGDFSPDTQRRRIESYARFKEIDVEFFDAELNVSGGTMDRPILNQVLARIESGELAGIVVSKLDRFARTLAAAEVISKNIEDRGGVLLCVEPDLDTRTPMGQAMRNIMLVFAQMERDQRKEDYREGRRAAVARGVFPGPLPLGYTRFETDETKRDGTPKLGPLVIDDEAAKHVRRAFYIAAGRAESGTDDDEGDGTVHGALAYLEEHFPDGVEPRRHRGSDRLTSGKRAWTVKVAQQLLARRVYIGEIKHGSFTQTFPEIAIVPPMIFELAQDAVAERARKVVPRTKLAPTFPLTHIATCGTCGRGLVAQLTSGRDRPRERRYRCIGCEAPPSCLAQPLEKLVLDAVRANPTRLNRAESIGRRAALLSINHELEEHRDKREDAEQLGALSWWEGKLAHLEAELVTAREAASARQTAPLPDMTDPSPSDQRVIFERAVESLVLRRLPTGERRRSDSLAERVVLELRK